MEMSNTGVVESLWDKDRGVEYAYTASPLNAFRIKMNYSYYNASSVYEQDDELVVLFGSSQVSARFSIIETDSYIAFRLNEIVNGPVDEIEFLKLRVKKVANLATWVNASYDDDFGVCLCAGTPETDAKMYKYTYYQDMLTRAYPDPGFDNIVGVVFGFEGNKDSFLDYMQAVEEDFNLPPGAEGRRSPIQKYSYFWPSPTPENIHDYITWAKRGGFRMILISYTSFSTGVGHFKWNSNYPNGMSDLKYVIDAIKAAGLKTGLHIHYNKAYINDEYVTPVADDRFHKYNTFTLASDISSTDTVIPVNENPAGSVMDENRRILRVGGELIYYTSYTTVPPYQFYGCARGHLKTFTAPHSAGSVTDLLDVDTWTIFILFDQNTDIQDEVAARVSDIYEQAGPFDMVYFDGAEDIHTPTWYHTANAARRVYQHFDPAPTICEAASNTHFSWHMMTRSNAYDSVAPEGMKDFCRAYPCARAPDRALNFTGIDFGWLHGFGNSLMSYIGPDILEFICSRGTAWDCPFSMTASLEAFSKNPLTEDCLDTIKIWEDVRIGGHITETQRTELKNLDQEHHLFINDSNEYELVAIDPVEDFESRKFSMAYTFVRESEPGSTYAIIWPIMGELSLFVDANINDLSMFKPFGNEIELSVVEGQVVLPLPDRRYVRFAGMEHEEVSDLLREVDSSSGVPTAMYTPAIEYYDKNNGMSLASAAGVDYASSLSSDCITPTLTSGTVDYRFSVPYAGLWKLWARMKYRDASSNSLFAAPALSPDMTQMLGNSYIWDTWIWEQGPLFNIDEAGDFVIRLSLRESHIKSPIVDVLCLTNDPNFEPGDANAVEMIQLAGRAGNPKPADTYQAADVNGFLTWSAGEWALSHGVYFGIDYDAVADANETSAEFAGVYDVNNYHVGVLDMESDYFWRVDEIGVIDSYKGAVWSFKTIGDKAVVPNPADGSDGVPVFAVPNFKSGCGAMSHDIYFGMDFADVNSAADVDVLPGRGNVDSNSYFPGHLEDGATYYWRVDEVGSGEAIMYKGDVWSFTTESSEITFDSVSSDVSPIGISAKVLSWEHTVGEGEGQVLVVAAGAEGGISGLQPAKVEYGGKELTLIEESDASAGTTTFFRSQLYYLLAPDEGTNDVVVTWPEMLREVHAQAISLINVKQEPPEKAEANFNSGLHSICTDITTMTDAAVIIDAVGTGEDGPFTPTNSLTTKLLQTDSASSSMACGITMAAEADLYTIGWDNLSANRITHSLAALGAFESNANLEVVEYELVSEKIFSGTVKECSYRVKFINTGEYDLANVTFRISSVPSGILILNRNVWIPFVSAGAEVVSEDIFIVRINTVTNPDIKDICWKISALRENDFWQDGEISYLDLKLLFDSWLDVPADESYDLYRDNLINYMDFALFEW
jgi:hypothetical protein